jgi:OHCU decarboxylase
LRVWGAPADTAVPGVAALNRMSSTEAIAALQRWCGSGQWATAMAALRPFEDVAALLRQGERVWWSLADTDWLEAFAAHPRIGETKPVSAWSSGEQQGVAGAPTDVKSELARANTAYAAKLGFRYIVCATGRSAEDMLADILARTDGARATELRTAAEEQAKITRLRIRKLMEELS